MSFTVSHFHAFLPFWGRSHEHATIFIDKDPLVAKENFKPVLSQDPPTIFSLEKIFIMFQGSIVQQKLQHKTTER